MAINVNDKSTVKNLCPYPISWKRITQVGDEYFKANASFPVLNQEIIAQVENRNIMLSGTDGKGSHAFAYIENEELREELGFDNKSENRKQAILSDEECEHILSLKIDSAFIKNLEEKVVVPYEKVKIVEYARKIKFNDYNKIKLLEDYCKVKF